MISPNSYRLIPTGTYSLIRKNRITGRYETKHMKSLTVELVNYPGWYPMCVLYIDRQLFNNIKIVHRWNWHWIAECPSSWLWAMVRGTWSFNRIETRGLVMIWSIHWRRFAKKMQNYHYNTARRGDREVELYNCIYMGFNKPRYIHKRANKLIG